jgi:hypothetical protein
LKVQNMKKIFLLMISIVLVVSGSVSSAIVTSVNNNLSTLVEDKTLEFTVSFPDIEEYNIVSSENCQRLEFKGFSYLMVPGKPMLPAKNYFFALPPGAKVNSVDFYLGISTQLQGTYDIVPVEPFVFVDVSNSDEQEKLMEEWQNNYQTTYSSDRSYPEEAGRLSGSGTLRKYSYASVSVCPFVYYPKSKQLKYYDSIEVIINYKISKDIDVETIKRILL